MNPEQQALLSVAVRLNTPTLSKQQQAVRTNLRKQARISRTEILNRRKVAIAAHKEEMAAFKTELEQVAPTLKQALEASDLNLEQVATERLQSITESGRMGMHIAAQEAL